MSGSERPIVCKDSQRLFIFMPLTDNSPVLPKRATDSSPPSDEAAVDPIPSTPERTPDMPRPPADDRPVDNHDAAPAQERPAGIDLMIAEAEELRATLGEAYSRV